MRVSHLGLELQLEPPFSYIELTVNRVRGMPVGTGSEAQLEALRSQTFHI